MSDAPAERAGAARQGRPHHARGAEVGDGLLMGSDDPTTDSFGPVQGMQVNYSVTDVDEAQARVRALAEGGKVTLPIGRDLLVARVRHVHRPVRHAVDGQRRGAP